MRKLNLSVVIIVLVWLTACSGKKNDAINTEPVIQVKVAEASHNAQNMNVSVSGKTESVNSANLSTRMMGYVNGVHVKVGDKVKLGQLLVSMNNSELMAKKAQAESSVLQATVSYNNAKKDYDRFVNLFNQQSASQKELDDMTSRFEIAKASLEAAKQMGNEVNAQFAYFNIAAPFDGIITNTFVKKGDMANPGMTLLSIEGESGLQVTSMVSESNIGAIRNGMKVKVYIKSIDSEVDGIVSEVSLSSKNTGSQYLVKVDLIEPGKQVLAGMIVNVLFPVNGKDRENNSSAGILVDESALVKNGQLTGIYTIGNGNVAILRWLRIGKKFDNKVEVLSGLAANEKYIYSAEGKLYNGVKVSF